MRKEGGQSKGRGKWAEAKSLVAGALAASIVWPVNAAQSRIASTRVDYVQLVNEMDGLDDSIPASAGYTRKMQGGQTLVFVPSAGAKKQSTSAPAAQMPSKTVVAVAAATLALGGVAVSSSNKQGGSGNALDDYDEVTKSDRFFSFCISCGGCSVQRLSK